MSLYTVTLFLHVTAALALAAGLGIEWTGLIRLRHARSLAEARQWAMTLRPLRRIGSPAMLVLLLSGWYMTATVWGSRPWISTGLAGLVLLGILGGGVTGRRLRAIGRALGGEARGLGADTRSLLLDSTLLLSLHLRTAGLAGIIFLMTTRPGWIGSGAILAGSLLLGLGTARLVSSQGSAPEQAGETG